MELARYLLIRFLTEEKGFKLDSDKGDILILYDGKNKVIIKILFLDIYEETILYKHINELMRYDFDKAYIAILPHGLPLVDPKHFRSLGLGLISVDPTRGLDGVEVRLDAAARERPQQQQIDTKVLSAVNAAVAEALNREIRRVEEELYNRLKGYVERELEGLRRALAERQAPQQQAGAQAPPPRAPIAENEWVKLLRRRGQT